MLKSTNSIVRLSASICLSALIGLSASLLPSQNASAQACNCVGGALATAITVAPTVAHVGDTVTVTRIGTIIGSLGGVGGCVVTNGISYIMYPNGNSSTALCTATGNAPTANGNNGVQEYEIHFNMLGDGCAGPDSVQCLPSVAGDAGCVTFTTTYVIQPGDVGAQLGPFVTPNPRPDGLVGGQGSIFQPAVAKRIHFATACDAFRNDNGQPVGGNGPAEVLILFPNIAVTKQCVSTCPPPLSGTAPYGQAINFTGFVTNTGDTALTNVTVVDNPAATITFATTTTLGNPFPAAGGGRLVAGDSVSYSGSYNPTGNLCGPFTDTVVACGTDTAPEAPKTVCATNSATCTVCTAPCIQVTKHCSTNLVVLCCSNGSPTITFSGIVTNCGTVPLTNVVVFDDLIGSDVLTVGSLEVGGSRPWSANFTVTSSLCGRSNIVNTATARGCNVCNLGQCVTNSDTCSFSVFCPCPSLTVTKGCASPIVTNVPNSLTVTGAVCNTGNLDFTDVIVVDVAPNGNATNDLGALAAGACKTYSFTYTTTACDANNDRVSATGVSSCGNASGTAPATCFVCCPRISVEKLVTCLQPGATCPALPDSYAHTATGAKGNTGDPTLDNPAFCYVIKVTNSGEDPLTNIVINDDKLGHLGTFPGPLAPNGTITISNLRTNWGVTTTNTVVVSGQCAGVAANGASVTATTNAIAFVVPANIACAKLVSLNGSTPRPSASESPCGSGIETNVVTWYAVVTNTGQATLCNITITEDPISGDDLPCGPVSILLTNCLAPGENSGLVTLCTHTYVACTNLTIHNFIDVSGTVTGGSNVCAINIGGSNIIARSQCNATVTLCCAPTVALSCRVTGGGRQDDTDSTGRVDVCPDDVRYVTHGGQVGAPVGNSNCVVTAANQLGNPCIHGRWTHVRHTKGGLEGNFHARYYDTLDCACLGTGFVSPGTCQYTQGVLVDGVCNPGDRIAGPEPRRAPANKIAFTGVGDWACPEGKREARACLFRVDIEDRSEPGGYQPGGAKPPADRYRIRIWVLSTAELAELNGAGPDPYLLNFRDSISACHGIDYRDGGVDCSGGRNQCSSPTDSCTEGANGSTGTITFPGSQFSVRLPNIDDGGELKNGNHQIHPQIKDCP